MPIKELKMLKKRQTAMQGWEALRTGRQTVRKGSKEALLCYFGVWDGKPEELDDLESQVRKMRNQNMVNKRTSKKPCLPIS